MKNAQTLLLVFFTLTFVVYSCRDGVKDVPLPSERTVEETRNLIQLRSQEDYSYLNGLIVNIVDTSDINVFEHMRTVARIATNIHSSDTAFAYCPCLGCPTYNNLQQLIKDSLSLETDILDDEMIAINNDTSMWFDCGDWFNLPSSEYFCDTNSNALLDYAYNNLDIAEDSMYITAQERTFIENLITDLKADPLTVDFQYYYNRWTTLNKAPGTGGWVSAGVLAATPVILQERGEYLLFLEGEGVIDLSARPGPWWLGGYISSPVGSFIGKLYSGIFEKGCTGLQDSKAGKMLFGDAYQNAVNAI